MLTHSRIPGRDGGKEVWEVPVGDTHKILVEWGAEFDNFDPVTQVGVRMGRDESSSNCTRS